MHRHPSSISHRAGLRGVLLGLVLVLVGLVAFAPGVHAQRADLIRGELERTDDLIREAVEVVQQSVGDRPRELLRQARNLQMSAWDDFRAKQFRSAAVRSARARELTLRAAELAKSELRLLDRVRHMLTENRDLIERAREALQQAPNPEARRLLEAGLNELERGQRAFADRQFRQAVRFSLFGRDLLQRAMLAATGDVGAAIDRVREQIADTDEFLREARLAVAGDDEGARQRLDEAARLQDEARALVADERVQQARRLTHRARERVLSVLRETGANPDLSLEEMIGRVAERSRDLRERAADTEDPTVLRWLDEAEDHLREARDAAAANRRKGALANVQLASNLLTRVAERIR